MTDDGQAVAHVSAPVTYRSAEVPHRAGSVCGGCGNLHTLLCAGCRNHTTPVCRLPQPHQSGLGWVWLNGCLVRVELGCPGEAAPSGSWSSGAVSSCFPRCRCARSRAMWPACGVRRFDIA